MVLWCKIILQINHLHTYNTNLHLFYLFIGVIFLLLFLRALVYQYKGIIHIDR